MAKAPTHRWEFQARFRRHAFGWRSQPAITRIRQAVAEIKKVGRSQPALAAEGAILLIERLSPALENVDSSSGAIGTAVNRAIADLVPIVAGAPADATTRETWLDRLFEAHARDKIPYIEQLADDWGELCGSREVASAWADRLIGTTRLALGPDKSTSGFFHGTSACLSALYRASRYDELIELLEADCIWPYRRWAVMAMIAKGEKARALRLAEACRDRWASDHEIDSLCQEILLSSGMVDEAYSRYGLRANQAGTYLATFRAVTKKYPHRATAEILAALAATTPGEEGKWFAAAKDAGLFDEALALASRTPCDPMTLTRAARDFAEEQPAFATGAGLLALHWLAQGYGYEIDSADVWAAYSSTLAAAERQGRAAETKDRIRDLVGDGASDRFLKEVLGRELDLPPGS